MQSDQMNTAFLENSNSDSSESDSQTLDDLVNPRPISVLLGELERNKNVQHTAVLPIPIAASENNTDDTIPIYFDVDNKKSSRVDYIISSKDDQISELKNDLESEENLNSELAKENSHLKQKIAKLELEQQQFVENKIGEHIKSEKESNDIYKKCIQTLEEKNEEISMRLRTAKVRYKNLKNELQHSKLALEVCEEKCQCRENEYSRLEEQQNRLEEKFSRLGEESSRLGEEHNRLEEESNRLKHDLETSDNANRILQIQIEHLQEQQVPPSNSCCNIS